MAFRTHLLVKQPGQLAHSHRDNCRTRKDTKYCKTKQGPITNPPQTMAQGQFCRKLEKQVLSRRDPFKLLRP